jgi:hypothetical protein
LSLYFIIAWPALNYFSLTSLSAPCPITGGMLWLSRKRFVEL